ncbi:aminoacyl-tRNA hydrolase [Persicimonas caeni]|uniref:Peptidyl-tRNA hydrolase n=1 Tax=Persicimonas caeni TaxID=2292766 RepID=A0A4Y6PPQ9_PERCE|nr:aminoacyl-tRNA hydrolase [Persicimonas caeni]QDG50089.1 aminoacyl-tRNA hydrolase [Persicimonas caeni]QED31310.1 aminoacyl-tRNA hydrolase [Persicimonas caeni]
MSRFLIAGLGNPGSKYARTRHNIGFMALDRLAERHRIALGSEKFDSRFDTGRVGGEMVVLLEPQTYMNRSGKAVQAAASFYDLSPDQIIVVHDEIDLPLGSIRIKRGGGHGGHNGLRDIVNRLSSKDFIRVRLGVGRPEHGDVTNHVLGAFDRDEQDDVAEVIETACDAVETIISDGVNTAQNRYNS